MRGGVTVVFVVQSIYGEGCPSSLQLPDGTCGTCDPYHVDSGKTYLIQVAPYGDDSDDSGSGAQFDDTTDSNDVTVTYDFIPAPAHDGFASPVTLPSASGTLTVTSAGASLEPGEYGVSSKAKDYFLFNASPDEVLGGVAVGRCVQRCCNDKWNEEGHEGRGDGSPCHSVAVTEAVAAVVTVAVAVWFETHLRVDGCRLRCSVWMTWTTPSAGLLTIGTTAGTVDPVELSLFTDDGNHTLSQESLVRIGYRSAYARSADSDVVSLNNVIFLKSG